MRYDFNISDRRELRKLLDNLGIIINKLEIEEPNSSLSLDIKNNYMFINRLMGLDIKESNVKGLIYSYYNNKCYGEVGEYTGILDYHVGDVLSFGIFNKQSLIVKSDDQYFLNGWKGIHLSLLNERVDNLKLVKKYNQCDYSSGSYGALHVKYSPF